MSQFLKSSIARKIAMALSAFFLMIFILQHFAINILSVFNPELFNDVSHFMGTNPLVQFVLQPVLIFGVVFHFLMGFVLSIESLNTSLEKICDFVHPDFNKKIGSIKDMAAGAVSFAVISSLIILLIIYYPYMFNL